MSPSSKTTSNMCLQAQHGLFFNKQGGIKLLTQVGFSSFIDEKKETKLRKAEENYIKKLDNAQLDDNDLTVYIHTLCCVLSIQNLLPNELSFFRSFKCDTEEDIFHFTNAIEELKSEFGFDLKKFIVKCEEGRINKSRRMRYTSLYRDYSKQFEAMKAEQIAEAKAKFEFEKNEAHKARAKAIADGEKVDIEAIIADEDFNEKKVELDIEEFCICEPSKVNSHLPVEMSEEMETSRKQSYVSDKKFQTDDWNKQIKMSSLKEKCPYSEDEIRTHECDFYRMISDLKLSYAHLLPVLCTLASVPHNLIPADIVPFVDILSCDDIPSGVISDLLKFTNPSAFICKILANFIDKARGMRSFKYERNWKYKQDAVPFVSIMSEINGVSRSRENVNEKRSEKNVWKPDLPARHNQQRHHNKRNTSRQTTDAREKQLNAANARPVEKLDLNRFTLVTTTVKGSMGNICVQTLTGKKITSKCLHNTYTPLSRKQLKGLFETCSNGLLSKTNYDDPSRVYALVDDGGRICFIFDGQLRDYIVSSLGNFFGESDFTFDDTPSEVFPTVQFDSSEEENSDEDNDPLIVFRGNDKCLDVPRSENDRKSGTKARKWKNQKNKNIKPVKQDTSVCDNCKVFKRNGDVLTHDDVKKIIDINISSATISAEPVVKSTSGVNAFDTPPPISNTNAPRQVISMADIWGGDSDDESDDDDVDVEDKVKNPSKWFLKPDIEV